MQNRVKDLGTTMREHQGCFGLSFFLVEDLELFGDVSMNWLKDADHQEHESDANALASDIKRRA